MSELHRDLAEDEMSVFKQWARDNYTAGESIKLIWHPVIVEECKLINKQKIEKLQEKAIDWNSKIDKINKQEK